MPTRRERALVEQQRAQEKKNKRNLLIGGIVIALGAIAVVAVLASGVLAPQPAAPVSAFAAAPAAVTCSPLQTFPTQSQQHIAPGETHPPYSSNPPTSGWHWANPQDWGIYTTPQVQEQIVHNLEHGGINIQYNNLTPAEVQHLTDLVQRDSHHMILAPYPDLPSGVRIALTAWDHLRTCDGVDDSAIQGFTNAFRDRGPELVP